MNVRVFCACARGELLLGVNIIIIIPFFFFFFFFFFFHSIRYNPQESQGELTLPRWDRSRRWPLVLPKGAYLSRTTRHRDAKAAASQPLQIAWSAWMARLPDDVEPHRRTPLT